MSTIKEICPASNQEAYKSVLALFDEVVEQKKQLQRIYDMCWQDTQEARICVLEEESILRKLGEDLLRLLPAICSMQGRAEYKQHRDWR